MRGLAVKTCAICERTLLTGEQAMRFAPHRGAELVDVCPLCQEDAADEGWVREGSPSLPAMRPERRRRGLLAGLFETRRESTQPVASNPVRRRLSPREAAITEAADQFNSSPFRRTVAGIARSLGAPQASIVHLSGVNKEIVITIAWDISWYQYRVSLESIQGVRLAERGMEFEELDPKFRDWNARLEEDGRLVPDVARR